MATRTRAARRARWCVTLLVLTCTAILWFRHKAGLPFGVTAGVIMAASLWMGIRLLVAASNAPVEPRVRQVKALRHARVVAVVPFHNEDPELFRRCLASIDAQTRPPDAIWLVDDGSHDGTCTAIAQAWAQATRSCDVEVRRFKENVGKRRAQVVGFANDRADFWMTLDSDTVLDERAIEEGIKPFAKSGVQAVAGLTLGYNWRQNVLTRILDIDFVNSFLLGRAAQSRFGAVLVACGTLAFYRGDVIENNLDAYRNETFFGHPVRAGDDRFLTQCSLLQGDVFFQESSIAYTALPERLGHLVRQRLRWSSSFYRGVCWVTRNLPMTSVAYWLVAAQLVELAFVAVMFGSLLVHSTEMGIYSLAGYAAYLAVLSYIRCIRYVSFPRADMRWTDRVASALLAPLIGLLYLVVLTPLRYYAVFRITDSTWRTRGRVEVAVRT